MIALITAALSLLAIGFNIWLKCRSTEQEKQYENVQQGRQDIADSNTDAVNTRIDKLLSQQGSDPPGQPSSEVTAERINSISRVVDPGVNSGTDSGKG